MVKKIIMFSLLSFVSGAIAQQGVIKSMKIDQINPKTAEAITFKITIRPDMKDNARWEQLVENNLDAIKKMQTDEKGGLAEMIRNLSEALRMVGLESEKVKGNNDGIHGEMKISISDGEKKVKKCGDACPCISKYKGVCPCTAENNCCSSPEQIRAACSAACQKNGCKAAKCVQTGCLKSRNK